MDMNKLNVKIIDSGMTIDEVATRIGMSGLSLYFKMKRPMAMTVSDAIKLKETLNMSNTEAIEIFLH